MPRSCAGRDSSPAESSDGVREYWADGEDCAGVGCDSPSPLLSDSSSPMAKAPPSSGTLVNTGVLGVTGLWALSTELLRKDRPGLFGDPESFARSFLRCLSRSISSLPLSRVNDRNASKRFFDLTTVRIKMELSIGYNWKIFG